MNDVPITPLPDAEESSVGSFRAFLMAQPVKHLRRFMLWVIGLLILIASAAFGGGTWVANLQNQNEITQLKSDLNTRNAVAAGEQAAKLATLNAEWESRLAKETDSLRQEINDLKVEKSGLTAKVEAMEAAAAAASVVLSRRDADLSVAQSDIRKLRETLALSDRKFSQAAIEHQRQTEELKNCAGLKKDADDLAERARVLRLEHANLKKLAFTGTNTYKNLQEREPEITAELDILNVRLGNIRAAQEACRR